MCQKRLQYRRPHLIERREMARTILRALATCAPDPFTTRQAQSVAREVAKPGPYDFTYLNVLAWLRLHRFIQKAGGNGTWHLHELTEQAIRWLDWTGFDWKRRAA